MNEDSGTGEKSRGGIPWEGDPHVRRADAELLQRILVDLGLVESDTFHVFLERIEEPGALRDALYGLATSSDEAGRVAVRDVLMDKIRDSGIEDSTVVRLFRPDGARDDDTVVAFRPR